MAVLDLVFVHIEDLVEMEERVWDHLEAGTRRSAAAFHTGVLATVDDMGPDVRTVVLRVADRQDKRLICHIDARSKKCADIEANNRISWLFYDDVERLQVRLRGTARLHRTDDFAEERWAASPNHCRRIYFAEHAPGTESPMMPVHMRPPFDLRNPTQEESEVVRPNFAAIETFIESMDVLILYRMAHRRARIVYGPDGVQRTYLAP